MSPNQKKQSKKKPRVSQLTLAEAGFVLTVRKLASLRPHEKTIPRHVADMAAQLRRDGVQKDPMLIDRGTGTVLDGMHRLAAFHALGMQSAVCCELDYGSDRITVGRWARAFKAGSSGDAELALRKIGFTRSVSPERAIGGLMDRTEGIASFHYGDARLLEGKTDLARGFRVIEEADKRWIKQGWERSFIPDDAVEEVASERGVIVLLVQKLLKGDVIGASGAGVLFPCKTSMHMLDPRPVGVRFPLSELSAEKPSLAMIMRVRPGSVLPAGSSYEGRRYKERLLLLNPG